MKIKQIDLSVMLKEHGEWLESGGVSGRQLNLTEAVLDQTDLTGADLRYAVFKDAKLIRAILNKADLSFADLRGARLDYAKCEKANFSNSLMSGVRLEGAFLLFSKFAGASLNSADLRYADCRFSEFLNAKLTESKLGGANFTKTNFDGCIFLDNLIDGAVFAGAKIDESLLRAEHDESEDGISFLIEKANTYSLRSMLKFSLNYYRTKRILEMGCYYFLVPVGLFLSAIGVVLRSLNYFHFLTFDRKLISSVDGYELTAIGFAALVAAVLFMLMFSFTERNRVTALSGILDNSVRGRL
jgi:uncharacterized protein YjbI with pentapeptide repeats